LKNISPARKKIKKNYFCIDNIVFLEYIDIVAVMVMMVINKTLKGGVLIKEVLSGDIKLIAEALLKDFGFRKVDSFLIKEMNKKQKLEYQIFLAEKVLYIFEEIYLNDKRPREFVEAGKKYFENPSKENEKCLISAGGAIHDTITSIDSTLAIFRAYAHNAVYATYEIRIDIIKKGLELLKKEVL
jgi:hypothetical protein